MRSMGKSKAPSWFFAFDRNNIDYEGCIVFYLAAKDVFLKVAWGTGDNLDQSDVEEGYDDYIMVESYQRTGDEPLQPLIRSIVDKDGDVFERMNLGAGLRELDGGMLLVKRRVLNSGDIRDHIPDAVGMAGLTMDDMGSAISVYSD